MAVFPAAIKIESVSLRPLHDGRYEIFVKSAGRRFVVRAIGELWGHQFHALRVLYHTEGLYDEIQPIQFSLDLSEIEHVRFRKPSLGISEVAA